MRNEPPAFGAARSRPSALAPRSSALAMSLPEPTLRRPLADRATPAADPGSLVDASRRGRSPSGRAWQRFRRYRPAMAGLVFVVALILVAVSSSPSSPT